MKRDKTALTSEKRSDILKGTTLEVYLFLVKAGKPVGAREIQRTLNLSSTSVATYHLNKLEDSGIIRNERGNYVVNKLILKDTVKIKNLLIPRYFFYLVFSILILTIELAFFTPKTLDRSYFIFTVATTIFVIVFCYETIKKIINKDI